MIIQPLLRLKQILGDPKNGIPPIIPLSRSAWYKGIKEGRFPQGIKLGTRSIAWKASDIAAIAKGMGRDDE
jgi:prophage regulatory protein